MNHQIFERMLCFRVLLEACLFECLFSPLVFSSSGGGRGLWCVGLLCGSPSAQVERRRERSAGIPLVGDPVGKASSMRNLNQRGATQVKTMSGRGGAEECRPSRANLDRPTFLVSRLRVARKLITFRTSNQARGPAEFKHITKRRKRN